MRNNDNVDKYEQSLVDDRSFEVIARGQVPEDAGHQLLDLVVRRFT